VSEEVMDEKLYRWNGMIVRRTVHDRGWEFFDPRSAEFFSEGWYSFYDDCPRDTAVVRQLNYEFGRGGLLEVATTEGRGTV